MKKRIGIFLLVFALLLLQAVSVSAGTLHLHDEVGKLTAFEIEEIDSELYRISELYDFDVLIAVTEEMAYDTPRESAEQYFASHATRNDGIILLLAMSDRSYCIKSTAGYGEQVFDDSICDYLFDCIASDLGDNDYASAFSAFARQCDSFLEDAANGTYYGDGEVPSGPLYIPILIALGIGIVIAFLSVTVMKAQLKTVRPSVGAEQYVIKDSFEVSARRDIFLHRTISKTAKPKPQNNSSGGGGGGGGGGGCSSGHF